MPGLLIKELIRALHRKLKALGIGDSKNEENE